MSTQARNEGQAHLSSENVVLHAWYFQVINELYRSYGSEMRTDAYYYINSSHIVPSSETHYSLTLYM